MATSRARSRSLERIARLSRSLLDSESIRREAIAELRRVIGFDRWCWPLADPETLLPSSGLAEHDYGSRVGRSLELEYSSDTFAAKHALARRPNPAAALSDDTNGDLARSARWDEVLRVVGIGDIAVVACRDELGCWGWIEAYRDQADTTFDKEDLGLLMAIGPMLGAALRRTAIRPPTEQPGEPAPPGVLVLDHELRVVSSTPGARAWMQMLPSAELHARFGILPTVVYPAAALARSANVEAAHALLRTVDGRWVIVEAAPLIGREEGEIAITLRGATFAETFDFLCRAYGFSRREREVVEAVVAGLDTETISKRLFISPLTVQDHLKSVFEKVGVHSRRELLASFNPSAGN